MENGESTEQAAARETREEACATVENIKLYGVFSIPHINQVYMMFRADISNGEYQSGPESLDVQLYEKAQIPWDELAFPVVKLTLEHYFTDMKTNHFPVHVENIHQHPARQG